jgi:putative membrane protein
MNAKARNSSMKNFLLRWFINSISLLLVVYVVSGIVISSWLTAIAAALVLGLLNAFVRPLLIILTLPVNILTLGLFTLIVNGFMFYLVALLVPGFVVAGYWNAFLGALVFSIISFLLSLLTRSKETTARRS